MYQQLHNEFGLMFSRPKPEQMAAFTSVMQYYIPYFTEENRKETSGKRINLKCIMFLTLFLVELHDEEFAENFLGWAISMLKKNKQVRTPDGAIKFINAVYKKMHS